MAGRCQGRKTMGSGICCSKALGNPTSWVVMIMLCLSLNFMPGGYH